MGFDGIIGAAGAYVDRSQEQLSQYCSVTAMSFQLSNNSSGGISSRGINKAFGMQVHLGHAGITMENTIAFGDGVNDVGTVYHMGSISCFCLAAHHLHTNKKEQEMND